MALTTPRVIPHTWPRLTARVLRATILDELTGLPGTPTPVVTLVVEDVDAAVLYTTSQAADAGGALVLPIDAIALTEGQPYRFTLTTTQGATPMDTQRWWALGVPQAPEIEG